MKAKPVFITQFSSVYCKVKQTKCIIEQTQGDLIKNAFERFILRMKGNESRVSQQVEVVNKSIVFTKVMHVSR